MYVSQIEELLSSSMVIVPTFKRYVQQLNLSTVNMVMEHH